MAKSKKRKKQHHNPEKDIQAAQTVSSENNAYEIPRSAERAMQVKQKSDKPLFLRIVMLAIAAAMIIGIVFEAVAGLISA